MTHSHVDSLNTEWLQWLIAVRGITVSCEDVVIVLWLLQDITKLLQKCKEEVSIRLALCKLQVSDCQSLISTLQAMSCKSSVWTQVSDVSLCLCVNAVCVCVCVCVCRSARCHRWSKRYVLHLIDAVMKSLNTERRVTAVMKSLNTERRVTAVMKSLNTEWLLWWSLWTLNDCCDEVFEHWMTAVMKSLNTERRVTAVMESLNTERRVTAVMESLNTERRVTVRTVWCSIV